MAELDYAYLAEYARVDPPGAITAVGASYTHIFVPTFPGQHLLSVAGRIRTVVGEGSLTLGIAVRFEAAFELKVELPILEADNARPYNDKVGRLFAITTVVPLPGPGLYEVDLSIDGENVRRLAFDAELAGPGI